ncbi:hypothetical protein POTOM_037592 [Populus tomentosa]|uniref:Uncharacterized protein n=1 Tax=Populus tomentosa TaxID=118781 RepID=A0A8X7Z5L7_POPTO|nr:hypothetical protein POTOM_037592 [Populus tomentosa]
MWCHKYAFTNRRIETCLQSIPLEMFAEKFVIQVDFACILKLAKLISSLAAWIGSLDRDILVPRSFLQQIIETKGVRPILKIIDKILRNAELLVASLAPNSRGSESHSVAIKGAIFAIIE